MHVFLFMDNHISVYLKLQKDCRPLICNGQVINVSGKTVVACSICVIKESVWLFIYMVICQQATHDVFHTNMIMLFFPYTMWAHKHLSEKIHHCFLEQILKGVKARYTKHAVYFFSLPACLYINSALFILIFGFQQFLCSVLLFMLLLLHHFTLLQSLLVAAFKKGFNLPAE